MRKIGTYLLKNAFYILLDIVVYVLILRSVNVAYYGTLMVMESPDNYSYLVKTVYNDDHSVDFYYKDGTVKRGCTMMYPRTKYGIFHSYVPKAAEDFIDKSFRDLSISPANRAMNINIA